MQARTRRLALTEGITAGVFFGTAAVFIRFIPTVDAFSIAFWRLVIAVAALTTVLFLFRKSFPTDLVRRNLKELFVLSLFLTLHFIFFISAVKETTILNATVLVNTTPIFSTFISAFFYKTRPSHLATVGLAVSFAGVCLISLAETTLPRTMSSQGVSPSLRGDLEAVFAAIVEAFYLNYGRRVRSQMSILPIMLPIYAMAAATVGVVAIPVTGSSPQLPMDTLMFLPILGLGILPTAVAHTLYFSSLSNLRSFETATMALLEPIGATILGLLLFHETPALTFVIGAALVFLGILFVVKQKS